MFSSTSFRRGNQGRRLLHNKLLPESSVPKTLLQSVQEIRAVSVRKLATRNCPLLHSLLITNALSNLKVSDTNLPDDPNKESTVGEAKENHLSLLSNFCKQDVLDLYSTVPSFQYYDENILPIIPENLYSRVISVSASHASTLVSSALIPGHSRLSEPSEDDIVDILSFNVQPPLLSNVEDAKTSFECNSAFDTITINVSSSNMDGSLLVPIYCASKEAVLGNNMAKFPARILSRKMNHIKRPAPTSVMSSVETDGALDVVDCITAGISKRLRSASPCAFTLLTNFCNSDSVFIARL